MRGRLPIAAGAVILSLAWLGPLPAWVGQGSFVAHMVLHMAVVGLGVPLLAAGLVARQPLRIGPALTVSASLLDFAVIWVWHTPALHHAAAGTPAILALEQASFAAAAMVLWLSVLAGPPLAGAAALFMTSMHMTLLGALLGLAPRLLFAGHGGHGGTALADQHLGGVVMMALGGGIYLGAAMWLAARALRIEPRP